MKVLDETESCDVKDGDKKSSPERECNNSEEEHSERERHDSVDSEPMLTIDDSVANDECEISDARITSELRILELAEHLEERLFVAFLHSKVNTYHKSVWSVCDCEMSLGN